MLSLGCDVIGSLASPSDRLAGWAAIKLKFSCAVF